MHACGISRSRPISRHDNCEALRVSVVLASYRALPEEIRLLADKNFDRVKSNPHHPSLHLKRIGELWSGYESEITIERLVSMFQMGFIGPGLVRMPITTRLLPNMEACNL